MKCSTNRYHSEMLNCSNKEIMLGEDIWNVYARFEHIYGDFSISMLTYCEKVYNTF